MKQTWMSVGILSFTLTFGIAQDKAGMATRESADSGEKFAYSVTERGAHHKVWERIESQPGPDGKPISRTRSYTELATGMHFKNERGEWEEAEEKIEILPNNAGAVARKGQHKAIFPPEIKTGLIELQTPDGQWLRSRVWGLAYFDAATGESVLLAEVKESEGQLVGDNVVLYPNAFTDFVADIRYTYTKAGFEQDVVLREQPPAPEKFDLNPKTTRLQVLTEFVEAPAPVKSRLSAGAKPDETLGFGELEIGAGKAFSVDAAGGVDGQTPVGKTWTPIEGRDFLIEEVHYEDVTDQLQKLPQAQKYDGASLMRRGRGENVLSGLKTLLPKRYARAAPTPNNKPRRMAKAEPTTGLSFVLDYVTLNTSLTNYTFKGDTTYYLSGNVSLNGTNSTFEGGSVLKYASNVVLTVKTPVTWLGTPYRPVVLLSKNDGSVGEGISGANNDTTNHAAAIALNFDATTAATNLVLQNLRIGQAKTAVAISGRSGHILSHVQLVNCGTGLALTNAEVALRNALLARVLTNFTGSSATGRVEHLTSDRASEVSANIGANLFITNSLLVLATNFGTFTSVNNHTNAAATGIFTNVGAGSYYLVSGSTNRNVGTTNINPALLANLKKLTTSAPVASADQSIYSPTVWTQQVARDVDTPDLGYHYDPLDYLINNIYLTSTLTLTNDLAVAVHGNYGINLSAPTSQVLSQGKPDNLNVLTRYQTVQEQPVTLSGGPPEILLWVGNTDSGTPTVSLRFTDVPVMSGAAGLLLNYDGLVHSISVCLQDCQLRGCRITVFGADADDGNRVALTNNVVERGEIYFTHYPGPTPNFVDFRNNLFWRSSISLVYSYYFEGPNLPWSIQDNAFDNCVGSVSGDEFIECSHNGWVGPGGALFYPDFGGDVTSSTFNYATSTLGRWYQSSTNFINKGSRTANLAGLYHFTTQTNQTKETNSTVDIGYHYVAALSQSEGAQAVFISTDTTTQGSWKGRYGDDGYNVILDAASYPAYASVSPSGKSDYTWTGSTTDVRALEKAASAGRIAACWYAATDFTISLNLTDGQYHRVAFYCLDWDGSNGRAQTIEIRDAATSALLDSRSVSSFSNGKYLTWDIKGNVNVKITKTGGANAVLNGVFFSRTDQLFIDTDGDGIPDYLEDSNGNGTYASGDLADWNSADTDGDGMSDGTEILQGSNPIVSENGTTGVAGLQVFTVLE